MTRRSFYLVFMIASVAVAPVCAGIFSDGEPKATKGTSGEKAAFIEGTQKSLAPHTAGTLQLHDNKVMVFQYAKGSVTIPYNSISSAELGPLRGADSGKFWNFSKKFADKTRYLTILYSDKGAQNRLVFELSDKAANLTAAQIEIAQGKKQGSVQATTNNEELWWGDKYWRTNRNSEKWNKQSGSDAPKSTAPER